MVLPVGQLVVVGAANTPSEGVPPIVVQVLGVAITIPAAVTPVNDGQTAGQAAGSTEKVAGYFFSRSSGLSSSLSIVHGGHSCWNCDSDTKYLYNYWRNAFAWGICCTNYD